MHRFYFSFLDYKQKLLILKDKDFLNQILNVLRLKVWDSIILFNWKENKDFVYKIIEIHKKEISLDLVETIDKNSEININLNVFQSLPNKLSKIEYILQKWVEVWITKFTFFRAERSQKLSLVWAKLSRLNKIIIEASEQSWRNIIPELIISEDNISKQISNTNNSQTNLFFHTKNENSITLKEVNLIESKEINLFIWPEWWFSDREIEILKKSNFKNIYLWNRILRTETVSSVVWFFIWQIFSNY